VGGIERSREGYILEAVRKGKGENNFLRQNGGRKTKAETRKRTRKKAESSFYRRGGP